MRRETVIRWVAVGMAAGMSMGLVACKSDKERAEGQVAYQVKELRSDLGNAPNMIDLANESLQRATAGQNPNRAADVRSLQARIDSLQALRDRLGREVVAAQSDSNKFFTAWAKEANQAPVAERAQISQEMAARRDNRDRALGYLRSADASYASYVQILEQVERALVASPTEGTVQGLSSQVANAITEGNKAKEYMLRLIEQVDASLAGR